MADFTVELLRNGAVVDTIDGNIGDGDIGYWAATLRTSTTLSLSPGDVLTCRLVKTTPDQVDIPFNPWRLGFVRIRVKGGGQVGPG